MNRKNFPVLILLLFVLGLNCKAQNNRWIWANQFPDSLLIFDSFTMDEFNSKITNIAVDKDNNVLLAINYFDCFFDFRKISLAKVSNTGNILFKKVLNNINGIYSENIITDNNGNIYLVGKWGYHNDTTHLETLVIGNQKFPRIGGYDIFIVKYNSSGDIIWANTYGTKKDDYISNMHIGISGNFEAVVSPGEGCSNLYFNSASNTAIIKNEQPLYLFNNKFYYTLDIDTFKKYDLNKKLIFKNSTGLKSKYGSWIRNSKGISNHFYSFGRFGNYGSIDSLSWGNKNYVSRGDFDIMIGKFDTLGELIWIKTLGSKYGDYPLKIDIDKKENIYVLLEQYTFDCMYFDSNTIIYGNGLLFAKYDSSGKFLYADHVNDVTCTDMTIDNDDKLYFCGMLTDTTIFGKTTLHSVNKLFLAKYDTGFVSVINSFKYDPAIKIYPNPSSSGYFYVRSDDIKNQLVIISVYDLLGNQILSNNVYVKDHLSSVIQLKNVPKGIYLIKLASKENWKGFTSKLILN